MVTSGSSRAKRSPGDDCVDTEMATAADIGPHCGLRNRAGDSNDECTHG
jgi:hypothetical protein